MSEASAKNGRLGVVAIGRNEGERLERCLRAATGEADALVYVDSGSSDGSVKCARALGAEVVELDPDVPFTAARARNAGFAALEQTCPSLEFVQFVDGDCELVEGWLAHARATLEAAPDLAVVCGRRRERFPEASPYNRLADLEWDTPIGDALSCGGDAMIRTRVLREAGGYDGTLIAGEEPDLCLRIRRAGHRIERLDHEMTWHDADLTRFRQWWRRQVRSGHAFSELLVRHGWSAHPGWTRSVVSQAIWGGLLPVAILALALPTRGLSLLLGLLYAVAYQRIRHSVTLPPREARLYAGACVLGKVAQMRGTLEFAWNRWARRRQSALIEYKGPAGGRSR